jgi:peptidyl-prolyl cis-trans isomerase SurA
MGLKEYYSNHKDRYMWGERFRGTIYLCDDQSTLEKVRKMKKGGLFRKKYSDREIKKQLNTSDKTQVEIQKGIFQQGENQIIDHYAWNIGEKSQVKEKEPYMVKGKKIPPQPKSFQEARGSVLADYQNYLENQWLQQLKEKYKVQVNQEVFREIKQNQASK